MGTKNSCSRISPGCGFGNKLCSVVIVDNFDIAWPSFRPLETDAPLIVYADRMLPGEITFEGLKSIPGRDPKVIDHARLVKQAQFSQGDSLNIRRQLAASDARPNQLRFAVC